MTDLTDQNISRGETALKTYHGTLKSTSLIGGASALNILISMIWTKLIALLLVRLDLALWGYIQVTGLFSTVSGRDLTNSGVR